MLNGTMKLRRPIIGIIALVPLLGATHPAHAVAGHYNLLGGYPGVSATELAFTKGGSGPCNMTMYAASSNGVTGVDAAIIPIAGEKHMTLMWSATADVAQFIGGGLAGQFYSGACQSIGLGVGFAPSGATVAVPAGAAWLVVTSTLVYNASIDVTTSLA
jgi:hypothetical protein